MAAEESLVKLKEGNSRFASGKQAAKNLSEQRKATVAGQKPFATILTCSDSRVPPEHIFDAGIGEIFVVRTAGNIVDAVAIGSVEYAAEHLGTPLLVVMGHESCGAVKAACASGHAEGNINSIVKEIAPAAAAAGNDPAKAVPENVKYVLHAIREKSSMLTHLEKEGKLKIMGATYSLSTGAVSYL